jgi:hypothetical protein
MLFSGHRRGDLELPVDVQERLIAQAARDVIPTAVPRVSSRLDDKS